MKPILWFFLGMPAGALLTALWLRAQIKLAALRLRGATEMYVRTEETFRKIRDVINTPEQMTMTIVGLNAPVWVKQKGKIERLLLWELMQRYGNVMNIGAPAPFDDNAVYLTEPRP